MQNNFKYLDELIQSGAKEIVLDSDIVLSDGEESEYKNGIKLDVDDLTIDGNGYSVDANGKARIFHCTGKNITIKSIVLKNGFAQRNGGAIYNREGELTIIESTLTGNASQGKHHCGGAISNREGELTINKSTLTGNTAQVSGGAIHNEKGSLTITESTLTENTANVDGGAISNREGELTITKSSLQENTAYYGGAINSNNGELAITDSSFTGNTSQGKHHCGGAIHDFEGKLKIIRSTFKYNTAQLGGGAIYNRWGELTIIESTLADNSTEGSGGAIYTIGPLNIKESSLTGNGAKRDGGAIFNYKGTLTIDESSLTGNGAQQNGGAIYYEWGEINLIDSVLSKNAAKGEGGAVWLLYSTKYKSNNCTFKDNSSNDVYVKYESVKNYRYLDEVIHSEVSEIVLDCDIILDEDEKSQYKRGIKLDADNLVIDGSGHFINAKAASIFHVTGSDIVLKNFIFKGAYSSHYGGAIRNSKGKLSIQDCIFEQNSANYGGGAIDNSGEMTISGSVFNKNSTLHAKYSGGGAIVNNSKLRISDSSFTDNSCEIIGAIYNYRELSVDGCSFESNISGAILNEKMMRIENSRFSNHSYSAISNEGGYLTVVGCNFESNSDDWGGGAIYNYGMTILLDSSFKDNFSKNGGAIDNGGQLIIRGCQFKSNKSDSCGGAIGLWEVSDGHELTIMDSSFESNEAKCGGAIRDENIWIRDSVFRNNFSKTGGSAIGSNHGVNICGCDFESNVTEEGGATIGANMHESEIKDCTFKDNKPSDVYDN